MHSRTPSRPRPCLRRLPLALATASLLCAALPVGAGPLPGGLQVIRGQANVVTHGQQMTVTNSAGAILNWQQFSIGQGQSVYFQQPSSLSSVLNRVTGRDPSNILGSLGSNGRVWLLNPQGVLFGRDARIDVAGLVASTLNISDADWAAGRYRLFQDGPGAALLNQGELRSVAGGRILLIGGSAGVRNEGLVEAPGGQVMLAAGQSVELVDTALPNLAVRVDAPAGEALNLGRLVAGSGQVDLMAAIVNQSGIVRADALGDGPGGHIRLDASERLTLGEGSLGSATGATGGGLLLQGRQIALLDGAVLDASGRAGGGTVFVGGGERGQDRSLRNAEALWMAPGARILADATGAGDGGSIVLWSDRATRAYGTLSARGGAAGGDGGFIETSGGWLDARPAAVRTDAPRGRAGRWLLDPWDITISDTDGDSNIDGDPDFTSTGASAVINTATIEAALEAGNNVSIVTASGVGFESGDIRMLNATIDVTPTAPVSLLLQAERNIVLDFATIRSRGEALSLSLLAANGGAGAVTINASTLVTRGGDITVGGNGFLCNFRFCDGEFGGAAMATDFIGASNGITIASSELDATGGRISLHGFSEVSGAETAGVMISDGSVLRARDIDILGIVVSNGNQQRTGVKIAGGLVAATNSIDIEGYAYAQNYSFDGSVVGVDILGEVRVDGEGASGSGDSLLSVYGYSEDNIGYGYGGYGGYGGFGAAPRYGLGIRGGTARVAGTGGVEIDLQGEVGDPSGNFGLLVEGTGAAIIDAAQARDLRLTSGGPMKISGDLRVSEVGGSFFASAGFSDDLQIVGATITGDPAAVSLSGYRVVIGTELEPARLVFGDATEVSIASSTFLFGTDTISLPGRASPDQAQAAPDRMRPLAVLVDLPPASTLLAAGGPITVQADAVSIGAGATIFSPHEGLAITLTGSGQNGSSLYVFQNAGGADALSTPNGWWEVWSYQPEGDGSFDPGGLVPGYRQYGATYGSSTPFFAGSSAFLFDTSADLTLVPLGQPLPFTKVYDGTTALPPSAGSYDYTGLVGNDVLVGSAGYDSKNVGSGKNIVLQPGASATGIAGPDGAPVYGYNVDNSAGAGLGAITPATLNLTGAVVADRAYDGTVDAAVSQWNFSGYIAGDDLGVVGSATFADKNVGVAKAVSLVVTDKVGVDAGNYVFGTALTGSATASITPALLTLVSASVPDKTYDATTGAAVDSLVVAGLVTGDLLSYLTSAAFDDRNVGTAKDVTVTLTGFSGIEQGNYALGTATSVLTTAAISPATVDLVAAAVANKVYDTTVAATVSGYTLAGTFGGDDVAPLGSGVFADKNVGAGKTVTVTLGGLAGTDAGNYVLGSTVALASANITPAPLSLAGGSAANKVYDATANATATGFTLSGVLGTDVVTGIGGGSFADKQVGSSKTVTLTLSSLGGADGANYAIVQPTATTTANISAATLDLVGGSAADKVYDGSTAATVTGLTLAGVLGSDAVAGSGSGAFADKQAANGKTVALTLSGLTGADAGNYVIGTAAASTTASITPATVNLDGGVVANKTYDRTTGASVGSFGLVGVVAGDGVGGSGSGSFVDANVGVGKPVNLLLSALTGPDAGNYVIGQATGSSSASILPAPVSLAAGSAAGKTYDGTVNTTATALTLAGVIAGDTVTGSGDARFADRNAGTDKPVTLTLLGLGGADAGNYTLGNALTATTTATIAPALLTYVATPATIGSTDPLPGFTGVVTGLVGGDTLAGATTGTAVFNAVLEGTPQPGSYAINGSGLAATNYSFTQAAGNATALTVLIASAPPPPPPPPPITGEEAAGVVSPVERIAGVKPPRDLLPQPFVTMPEIGRLLDLMQGLEPGRTDLFGALDINGLGPDRMAAVLAARDEYKKTLFAQALDRLEQDPSIADAPGCATAQQAASGQCLMVTPLDRESVISNARVIERLPVTAPQPPAPTPAPPAPAPQAGTPPAAPVAPPAALAARPPVPVVVPAFPDRRAVRQAVLPQIQRKIAVVIGVDEYADPRIPRLANSVRDAQAVARSLETTLGYETVVLENPTKAAMFRVFNRLAAETGPNDSVVLYYAGHGELVEKTGLGYWQPSDADVMRPETWVSNSDINRVLRGIGASQVALVSDSCFSGSLVGEARIRGVSPTQDPAQLLSRRAAVVMSSGGNEPVADSGKNGHSPFAFSLMQTLERVPTWRPGSNIFEQVRFQVARQLPQRPQYGASTVGGHEPGADYLFEQRQIEGVTR